ncbi:MAG: hypothetical protein OEN23_05980 [Paracoccaceae bacterium]|nr:hypothetical protein [Paracoccaceae bacterium]
MFIWVFRLMVLFAILTLIYVVLSQYSRWNHRKTLEADYDATDHVDENREEFVAEGMSRYEHSLSKRLLLGVFVLPIAIVAVLLLIAYYM